MTLLRTSQPDPTQDDGRRDPFREHPHVAKVYHEINMRVLHTMLALDLSESGTLTVSHLGKDIFVQVGYMHSIGKYSLSILKDRPGFPQGFTVWETTFEDAMECTDAILNSTTCEKE